MALLISSASLPSGVQSHRYGASDIKALSFFALKHSDVPLPAVTFPTTSVTSCFHLERRKRGGFKLVSAQISDGGASDL